MKKDWLHITGREFIVFERKLFLLPYVKLCFLHSVSIMLLLLFPRILHFPLYFLILLRIRY